MEFNFSKNFSIKMVEKIIDDIISEARKEGRLENYGVGINEINIKGNGYSSNIKCDVNLCEYNPQPNVIQCDFNIKQDLFQTIPIHEVEGICTYSGFLFKESYGRIKVIANKVSKENLELSLIWLDIDKTINKTYRVQDKEFIEVVNYSDDEDLKKKDETHTISKKAK